MDGGFCEHCGRAKQPLPCMFGVQAVGCAELSCAGVHPYFVSQVGLELARRIEKLEAVVGGLQQRVEAGPWRP